VTGIVRATARTPLPLRTLLERFDPDALDLPDGTARIRLEVTGRGEFDVLADGERAELVPAEEDAAFDALLRADRETWKQIADDLREGMMAFQRGRLEIRENLHLGVGFLAATAAPADGERLRFSRLRTPSHDIAMLEAGKGTPLVCIHGLGGTKASFLPTVGALAPRGFRVVGIDLPGFGDSHKPLDGAYDASWFAAALFEVLDALGIERAHLVGNSMGGRIAIEAALLQPERVGGLVLLSPALAWLKPRQWKWLLRLPLPRLGAIQPAPRFAVEPIVRAVVRGAEEGWTAVGVDEFMRSYLTAGGRVAFYEAARNIYMDEPHGERGFWNRLRELASDSLFVWGREDQLVPIAFMRHVQRTLPRAEHLELDCGHVPQLERPDDTHRRIAEFLGD
jgi:pimeloyl-ACP methyl ester carboxylesterase